MDFLIVGGWINLYFVYMWCFWIGFYIKDVNFVGIERWYNKVVFFLIRIFMVVEKKNRDLDILLNSSFLVLCFLSFC